MDALNPIQQHALMVGCIDIHRRMAELESFLDQADRVTPFTSHVADLAPVERQVVLDYFARIREVMRDLLQSQRIVLDANPISLRWALQTGMSFLHVAVADLGPGKLRGYGSLTEEGTAAALRFQQELIRPIDEASRYLRERAGANLVTRLSRLEETLPDVSQALRTLHKIIARRGLVEFQPRIDMLLDRLEDSTFEVAVFGRVSSGKSSLLNHIAGQEVLPVGVTPITAVPARLTWGEEGQALIDLAESGRQRVDVSEVARYGSEPENPGNIRHVTRIEVRLPSPRLRAGTTFIDTPGNGSLARAGSALTYAYLPRCDLGLVLIDASSAINDEDLTVIRLLLEAGSPVQVLLSKCDLLSAAERGRMLQYIEEQLREQMHVLLPVFPVSIKGEDETLLTRWFAEEIAPLQERHRELAQASLRRKVVQLRDSVRTALEVVRDRASEDGPASDRRDELQRLLEKGDDAIRGAELTAAEWADDQSGTPEIVLGRIAHQPLQPPRRTVTGEETVKQVVANALQERGRSAVHFVEQVRSQLTHLLRAVADQAHSFRIEPAVLDEVGTDGLPVPEETLPLSDDGAILPWWRAAVGPLAEPLVFRHLAKRLGPMIREVLHVYDRQLSVWMRDRVSRLTTAYFPQVAVVREQLRRDRVVAESGDIDLEGLARDIDLLRQDDQDDVDAALAGSREVAASSATVNSSFA